MMVGKYWHHLLFGALAAAFWPVWWWYTMRMMDGSDEKWGLFSLGTLVVIGFFRRISPEVSRPGALAPITLLMLVYALSWPFLPPLARAMIAVTVLGILLGGDRSGSKFQIRIWGLLLLALPAVASMQYFLGFPMRVIAANLAVPLINATGISVDVQGTCMTWLGETVAVDPPCSGIRMLWTGLYLAFTISSVFVLQNGRTIMVCVYTVIFVILGNALRCMALFFLETGLVNLPHWVHPGIGLALFLALSIAVFVVAKRLGKIRDSSGKRLACPSEPSLQINPTSGIHIHEKRSKTRLTFFLAACLMAAVVPLYPLSDDHAASGTPFPGWPTLLDGRALFPLDLNDQDRRFQEEFPGRMARFTDGSREILFRWIPRASRKVHPGADCFRGAGYSVHPLPAKRGSDGEIWGCFEAVKEPERLHVRHRIYDEDGGSWTDVSSWYWSAVLGRSRGPWWAVTVAGPNKSL